MLEKGGRRERRDQKKSEKLRNGFEHGKD